MIFENPGKENTKEALTIALAAAKEKGIEHLVLSSNTGESMDILMEMGIPEELHVVVVTGAYGFKEPNQCQFPAGKRDKAIAAGIKVCTAAHALSGVERSLSTRFSGVYPAEIIAYTLRMFGAGTKVAVEIATMAADAGLIPVGKPVIAMGGTGRGLDTAWVIKASNSNTLLNTRLEECLCKPYVE